MYKRVYFSDWKQYCFDYLQFGFRQKFSTSHALISPEENIR